MASVAAPVPAPAVGLSATLRPLYFVRFAFATVWAALLFAAGRDVDAFSGALLVLYPAFDVGCAVVDLRSGRSDRDTLRGLYANAALSTLTAAGLLAAAFSGSPAVLRVWGLWAVTAGLVQLIVGVLRRRSMGGQWAMIISGTLSAVDGVSFIVQAGKDDPSLRPLASYALLGGIFFLVSALRLGRTARR